MPCQPDHRLLYTSQLQPLRLSLDEAKSPRDITPPIRVSNVPIHCFLQSLFPFSPFIPPQILEVFITQIISLITERPVIYRFYKLLRIQQKELTDILSHINDPSLLLRTKCYTRDQLHLYVEQLQKPQPHRRSTKISYHWIHHHKWGVTYLALQEE